MHLGAKQLEIYKNVTTTGAEPADHTATSLCFKVKPSNDKIKFHHLKKSNYIEKSRTMLYYKLDKQI